VEGNPAWLLLAYTLPIEPSRLRVSIWRRLRKLGAVYLDEGVWVLPNTSALSDEIRLIQKDIDSFNGKSAAFGAHDLDLSQRERVQAQFDSSRNEEYSELQGQCERFMIHVDHATATDRFTFAEVEELEEEISKLERWLEEIRSRDFFASAQAAICAEQIESGRQALVKFTERTFTKSGGLAGTSAPE
jgi:hypothetical protein